MSKINDGHFFGFMAVYTSITIINKWPSLGSALWRFFLGVDL